MLLLSQCALLIKNRSKSSLKRKCPSLSSISRATGGTWMDINWPVKSDYYSEGDIPKNLPQLKQIHYTISLESSGPKEELIDAIITLTCR